MLFLIVRHEDRGKSGLETKKASDPDVKAELALEEK